MGCTEAQQILNYGILLGTRFNSWARGPPVPVSVSGKGAKEDLAVPCLGQTA